MSNPTPGPWRVEHFEGDGGKPTVVAGYEDAPDSIAAIYTARVANEANARLIAAAPDLLDACRSLLACSLPTDISGQRMVARAIAAIERATKGD